MKTILKVSLVLIGTLLMVTPVLAGGWVVITLDALPHQPRASEPMAIGFMIRQHGQHPADGLNPVLSAFNPETGETLRVEAQKGKAAGHYIVEVTFPSEGVWEWSLSAAPFSQTMVLQPLGVLPASEVVAGTLGGDPGQMGSVAGAMGASSARLALRWIGTGLLLAALALAVLEMRQRRVRQALAMSASGVD